MTEYCRALAQVESMIVLEAGDIRRKDLDKAVKNMIRACLVFSRWGGICSMCGSCPPPVTDMWICPLV